MLGTVGSEHIQELIEVGDVDHLNECHHDPEHLHQFLPVVGVDNVLHEVEHPPHDGHDLFGLSLGGCPAIVECDGAHYVQTFEHTDIAINLVSLNSTHVADVILQYSG